jgi:hypothetical protein
MSEIYRPGFWCDVCVLADGRFAHVVAEGAFVNVYVDGLLLWRTKAGRGLMELRCAFALGRVVAIGIEQDSSATARDGGTVYLVTREDAKPLGLGFGAQAVGIDGTFAYVVRSNQSYDRIRIDNGEDEHLPHGVPGSSQGISYEEPDVMIRWADTSRSLRFAGLTLTFPNARGSVLVGQADPPQCAGFIVPGGAFTAFMGDAFEPHVAQSGDRYAIVARTPKGAAYVEVPPFPAFVSAQPSPPPPPVKPPDPKPEPVPMSSVNHLDVVQRVLQTGIRPDGSLAGNFAFIAAVQGAVRDGAGFVKSSAGGENTIPYHGGFVRTSRLIYADGHLYKLIADAGPGAANTPEWADEGMDDPGLFVAAVPDSGAPPADPPPQPLPAPPAPSVDLSPLLDRIAALDARVAALEQKPAPVAPTYRVVSSTGRTFGHSHSVNVNLEPK